MGIYQIKVVNFQEFRGDVPDISSIKVMALTSSGSYVLAKGRSGQIEAYQITDLKYQ